MSFKIFHTTAHLSTHQRLKTDRTLSRWPSEPVWGCIHLLRYSFACYECPRTRHRGWWAGCYFASVRRFKNASNIYPHTWWMRPECMNADTEGRYLTLSTQLLLTRRLPGLMSLCRMPAEWRYFRPEDRMTETTIRKSIRNLTSEVLTQLSCGGIYLFIQGRLHSFLLEWTLGTNPIHLKLFKLIIFI